MKAILGNFTKISESEFRLKKDLQFADVTVDEEAKIQTVTYQDKQDIQIGDILTHQDIDYEILDINADQIKYISVKVKANVQEQDVPEKPKFVARKMTPRTHKPTPEKQKPIDKPIEDNIPIPVKLVIPPTAPVEAKSNTTIPKKRNIFKRILGWIGTIWKKKARHKEQSSKTSCTIMVWPIARNL